MKKRLRLKKKYVRLLLLLLAIIIAFIIIGIIIKKINYKKTDEYMLTNIGYSIEEAQKLERMLSKESITQIIENEDYDNTIISLIEIDGFKKDNLNRYLDYLEHKNTSFEIAVLMVNIDADKDDYDEANKTDTSLNELMLVNKHNYLDESYIPDKLVNVTLQNAWNKNIQMTEKTYNAFINMATEAKNNGYTLMVNKGYTSYEDQKSLYDHYVDIKNERYADSKTTHAGYSEYQTGYTIDILEYSNSIKSEFENTEVFKWLKENSYKYGFILRYPDGKNAITGYSFQSYTFRYVGIKAAKTIYNEDITFEEYYAKYVK